MTLRQDPTWIMEDALLESSRLLRAADRGDAPPAAPMLEGGDETAHWTAALGGDRIALGIQTGSTFINLDVSCQAAHELALMIARLLGHRAARMEARWASGEADALAMARLRLAVPGGSA